MAFSWAVGLQSVETNCMSGRTFVDTNILIYAHDADARLKHDVAKRVLSELWSERTGVLSVQVLQEFFVNVTRKIASPLPENLARIVVSSYAIWCIETTPAEISSAFRIEDESRIGFWDALIMASVVKCGARGILSEDMNAGPTIARVSIEDPIG
jgi:predicted nucleic acid-binding protein